MAFTTEADAEGTAKSKVADGTYTEAFQQREADGTIAIRVLTPMANDGTGGDWQDKTS